MKQNKPSAQTATIREIARRAEVSIASVSRALNGKPGISDALRDNDTPRAVNRLSIMAQGFGGGTRIGVDGVQQPES